ncbi:MAG: sigma-70 family RNA polymerase sigma factor [Bacteroidota bacterium]
MIEPNKQIPDEEIIVQLQFGNDRTVDNALLYLHRRVYRKVVAFVKKYKGSDADGEDLFQDGMVALHKLARRGKLKRDTNVEAYLYTICRNIWYKQLKKRKETFALDENINSLPVEEVTLYSIMENEKKAAIDQLLSRLGESCKQLLVHYFYDRLKLKNVAELMGYASEQVAKNKKSECMKKLKTLVAENPSIKNIIS